jgi:arginyl-tRNA synthetase
VPVLKASNPEVINTRLRLIAASAQVIKNGLNLLGIEAPDKM